MDKSRRLRILDVPIDFVSLEGVLRRMDAWIESKERRLRYIVCASAALVMECQRNPRLKEAVEHADLVVPDGMPLVWLGAAYGIKGAERVTASDILLGFADLARKREYSSFFYGGAEGVPQELARRLTRQFPGFPVAGAYSPPFRELTAEEDRQVMGLLHEAHPDVLWIGLGCPKQELWVYDHQDKLQIPVAVCIGATFDFYSGRIRRAPRWMQRMGLEWLHRLLQEPRRLWRRYLVLGPKFVLYCLREALRSRPGRPR